MPCPVVACQAHFRDLKSAVGRGEVGCDGEQRGILVGDNCLCAGYLAQYSGRERAGTAGEVEDSGRGDVGTDGGDDSCDGVEAFGTVTDIAGLLCIPPGGKRQRRLGEQRGRGCGRDSVMGLGSFQRGGRTRVVGGRPGWCARGCERRRRVEQFGPQQLARGACACDSSRGQYDD